MLVKWSPIRGDKKIVYEQIDTDKLQINNEMILDFSDDQIIDYTIPEEVKEFVSEAKRDGVGTELKLTLVRYYGANEKKIWEDNNFRGTGNFRGTDYEAYDFNDILNDENVTWK